LKWVGISPYRCDFSQMFGRDTIRRITNHSTGPAIAGRLVQKVSRNKERPHDVTR
jgi:hypothetical protein